MPCKYQVAILVCLKTPPVLPSQDWIKNYVLDHTMEIGFVNVTLDVKLSVFIADYFSKSCISLHRPFAIITLTLMRQRAHFVIKMSSFSEELQVTHACVRVASGE